MQQKVRDIRKGASTASAANKMYNFQLVSRMNGSFYPGNTGNDCTILLDSYAIILETESSDEIRNSGIDCELWKFSRLTIDDKLHGLRVPEPSMSEIEVHPDHTTKRVPSQAA